MVFQDSELQGCVTWDIKAVPEIKSFLDFLTFRDDFCLFFCSASKIFPGVSSARYPCFKSSSNVSGSESPVAEICKLWGLITTRFRCCRCSSPSLGRSSDRLVSASGFPSWFPGR